MQSEKKESKKQAKETLVFEGGDEGDGPPKSKTDKKLDKYADDINSFKEGAKDKFKDGIVRDRSITDALCGILFLGFGAFLIALLAWTIK